MRRRSILTALTALTLGLCTAPWPGFARETQTVRIGMPAAMFREVKPAMFAALTKPFYALVHGQTGLLSELVLLPSPDDMRQQLSDGRLQFGVFHGFEFAWMKQKDPQLVPIMIAAPTLRPMKAYVVVNGTSPAKTMNDLRGKTLSLANGTREHARIFIDRSCQVEGAVPSQFFDKIITPVNGETALHEIYDNKAQAAIVDGNAMQCFAERYPARSKKLRTLLESPAFPLSAVVVKQGAMDAPTLAKFTDGMGKANASQMGKQLMSMMQMAGFEPVPPDYDRQLADVAKAFPPPADAPR